MNILAAPLLLTSQGPRNLLTGGLSERSLAAALIPAARWHPYPTVQDRADWEAVPQEIRAGFIREAQQYLGTTWERIPATVTLQYIRNGNRSNYDGINTRQREKLATLVFAEVFENAGRFLDEIADGIWAISEQTFWGSTAHLGMQRAGNGLPDVTEPIVDLFAAETGALLAWTDYLLGDRLDKVSPLLRKRIRAEVDRRVLTPALQRDDFWWMGFGERKNVNNWNPWINSNLLAAVLLLETDPRTRTASVYKIMRSLDNFIKVYPDHGACPTRLWFPGAPPAGAARRAGNRHGAALRATARLRLAAGSPAHGGAIHSRLRRASLPLRVGRPQRAEP